MDQPEIGVSSELSRPASPVAGSSPQTSPQVPSPVSPLMPPSPPKSSQSPAPTQVQPPPPKTKPSLDTFALNLGSPSEAASTAAPMSSSVPLERPVYASFGRRLGSFLVDAVIVGLVNGVLGGSVIFLIGPPRPIQSSIRSLLLVITRFLTLLISCVYYIYFTGSSGQTLGKKALKIKVIKVETNQAPGYFAAFLREGVGKFLSAVILCLGYFWMIWDKEKQTWHDKIAGTLVIKVE